MSEGSGFLEFFILEASDYVEQLDGLLLGGGSHGPDGNAMQRIARALRGTATMAKIPSFADLAGAVERVGRGVQEGALQWSPSLGAALVAAIDDLKALLHSARTWSPAEDRRATSRSAELAQFAPPRPRAGTGAGAADGTPVGGVSGAAFLATEAANIAAGLELITTRAGDADTAANVLRRVRALRGVAGVKEVGPLAIALEATEEAGRGLESGSDGRGLTPEARRLLETAAGYLRTLSSALRGAGDVNAPSPARAAFDAACDAWTTRGGDRERVVPIADLFYLDGGSGVVEASEHPPTTASERFRLELVSQGEHLRQVVDSARGAKDPASITRVQRELRQALKGLDAAAESFGEREVAEFIRAHNQATDNIDFLGLSALDDLASLVSEPGAEGQRLRARLRELAGRRDMATAIGAGFGNETPLATPAVPAPAAHLPVPPRPSKPVTRQAEPPPAAAPAAPELAPVYAAAPVAAPAPAAPPTRRPAVAPVVAPSVAASERLDSASAALIDSSIAALESFNLTPLLAPSVIPEDDTTALVPIENLLYRGRAALDRALEIRDELRRGGIATDPDALDELFDLVELARAE